MPTEAHHPENMFSATVAGLNKGRSLADLSDALAQIVAAVRDTGAAGKLVYTIDVKPLSKSDSALVLSDSIKPTLPLRPRKERILYGTLEGLLLETDPDQSELDFAVRDGGLADAPATPKTRAQA